MPDDPDNVPADLRRPTLDRGIGPPVELAGQNACHIDGKHYPEGSVMLVDGRPATCMQGRWIGVGDDPPSTPRRPDFLSDVEPGFDADPD